MNTHNLLFKNIWLITLFFNTYMEIKGQENNLESRVPKFNYPTTLKQQLKALEADPLMHRFKSSRAKFNNDLYRPTYHFVSPEGRLNDPNGLSFWNGKWHLFYQAYPPEDPRQHWGHAVSEDLVHWKDLPYAIYPGPERASFSGSAWVEDDRVIVMYHGTEKGNMIAIADDPLLLNWKKLGGKAVIPLESNSKSPQPYTVFDPFIWKKENTYYSLSGSRGPNGPGEKPIRAHYLFKSKNLLDWEYLHEFVVDDRFTKIGDDGACPYFWPIGNRHILLFFSHLSGAQYLLGDYDELNDKFNATSHGKFNFGTSRPSGIHAPSAFPDGKGGVIAIFNINRGKVFNEWDQVMSLPRQLSLVSEDEIRIEPVEALSSLRKEGIKMDHIELPRNKETLLEKVQGNTLEIVAEVDMRKSEMVEINVLRSLDKEEYTKIIFYKNKGDYKGLEYNKGTKKAEYYKRARYSLVSLETTYSSSLSDVNYRVPETAPVLLDPDENLNLRIFIDKSIIEVFVNGKQCIGARVFPSRADSLGISFFSQGNDAELIKLEAYPMKNIYTEP